MELAKLDTLGMMIAGKNPGLLEGYERKSDGPGKQKAKEITTSDISFLKGSGFDII